MSSRERRSGSSGLVDRRQGVLVFVSPLLTLVCVAAAGLFAARASSPPASVSGSNNSVSARAEKPGSPGAAYKAEIDAFRKERDSDLRSEDGWLTVAGLFWLKEGTNRFGTASSNDIVLPEGSAPARAGVFDFHGGATSVTLEKGTLGTIEGKPVATTTKLRPDTPGPADVLVVKALSLTVIKRGDRYGIRLKDKNRAERRTFQGTEWFPVNGAYRVTAEFVPYDPPRKIAITNVLGQTDNLPCPGYASFTLGDTSLRLEPVAEGETKDLFFIFRDQTSGKETYGAGRFLNAEKTADGKVVLDFNKAYSPPCAFTPHATCPLPPKQNALPIRVEAGEKFTGHR